MNIVDFVTEYYDTLPKSTFNGDECVIVKEINHFDDGYGHDYQGIGIGAKGEIIWCFSSGCSCDGTSGIVHEHSKEFKTLRADFDLSNIDAKEVDFSSLRVDFSSY